jgi:hypothetical protein
MALLTETHLKPHAKFVIPNSDFYPTDHFLRRKAELPVQLEKAFLITM